ncbi:MAG: hypothetical protein L6R38_000500 [Xanthoria sp. 2 TBL-2021]|nr:MAG: hypothetical protein L6R38_000500 [Xanthoria sp. 2 TBL-2021]
MATITETIDFGQYPLQVRPEPLRLRSGNKRQAIIAAPPSPITSRASSFESLDQDVEKLQPLPPVDGGIAAWKFLFAAFMIEAFIFGKKNHKILPNLRADRVGFPLNYGVFQSYYFNHPPFEGNTNLSTVGTLGTAFYFLGAPIATYLVRRYHRWQREVIWTGCSISVIGLVAASFAPDFGTLVATQGVVFGIGILIMYYPVFSMLNEWFIDRRGLALGILCAATGFSGLFYPFVLEVLLDRYGPATTLRVSAIALTVLCGPVLPLLKGRHPRSYHDTVPKTDFSFFRMPLFYIFSLATLLQGLGFYFPMIYLPSYATSLGLSDQIGASLLVVSSFAQMLGQVAFGYASDVRIKRFWMNERVPVEALVFISSLMSGMAILGLWGMASSILRLIAFAMVYGIFAGGFVVLWARMGTALSPSPSLALITFSAFACERGVGSVATGPISSALLTAEVNTEEYGIGRFKNIILYAGMCMLASAAVMVVWYPWRRITRWVGRKGEFCGCPK